MTPSIIQKFEDLKTHSKLPSPNGIALKIIQLASKEDASTQQMAKLISNDPALAGRIIKAANLIFRHEERPIASILDAVTVLGINSVRQLALSISLIDDFHAGPCKGFDYQKFWAHSACSAIAAQECVKTMHVGVADEAFLLGLVSQIGRLALATIFSQGYTQILEQSVTTTNQHELERNAFGLDHNQITAMMLADWGMPELFQKIALHIEHPEASEFSKGERNWRLLQLFHFADHLATICTSTPSERYQLIPRLMLLATRVGIQTSVLTEIGDHVIIGLMEWCNLLNIVKPTLPSFEEILSSATIDSELSRDVGSSNRQFSTFKLRILLVEDDRAIQLLYKSFLEAIGHTVTTANNGRDALEILKSNRPQIIISDWIMPEMDGIEFCKVLRANPEWRNIYIFIVTAQESTEKLIEAFEAGASDYLTKPINQRVLAARLRAAQSIIQMQEALEKDRLQLRQFADELALSNQRLQELALTDTLTGLPNRRYALERLEQAIAVAKRSGRPICCMMVDIDHFKSVNDTYGHHYGDDALKMIASGLRQAARKQDVVCRIGGEEFLVICADTDEISGFQYAERLRQHVSSRSMLIQDKKLQLTVSIGLTDNANMKDLEAMINLSDRRLYTAKAAGRNRTIGG